MTKRLLWFPKGMGARWWLFRPIDFIVFLLRRRKVKQGLLILKIDAIGDLILFHSVLDYYLQAFAVDKSQVTIVGHDSWRSLADTLLAGYRVVTLNPRAYERQFWYRLKWSLWLAKQNFKTATCDIYFRKPLIADSMLYYTGASRIAVCKPNPSDKTKQRFDYFTPIYTDVIDTGAGAVHETIRHYRFISSILNRSVTPQPIAIPWPATRDPIAQKPYVVINFGSAEPGRRWPFERFITMAKRILERGYYVVFLGGPQELAYQPMLHAQLQHDHVIDYIGKTKSLSDVLDILKHAHAVLTSETGPGHFALALQVPTLMLCGGGSYITFSPYPAESCTSSMHFLHHKMDCYGCLWRCPYRTDPMAAFPCVEKISVDDAWVEFRALLHALDKGYFVI